MKAGSFVNYTCIQSLKDIAHLEMCPDGYMTQARMVRPGDPAKNFSLKDQNDKTFGLYEQSGKHVLLSFHPAGMDRFLCSPDDITGREPGNIGLAGCIPVGISVDSRPCKRAWAESISIRHTRLLCDFWPQGVVAQKYGLFREENGFSERAKRDRR